jgi:hypothetical protein
VTDALVATTSGVCTRLLVVQAASGWPWLRLVSDGGGETLVQALADATRADVDILVDLHGVDEADAGAAAFLVSVARRLVPPRRLFLHDAPRHLATVTSLLWWSMCWDPTTGGQAPAGLHQVRQNLCLRP